MLKTHKGTIFMTILTLSLALCTGGCSGATETPTPVPIPPSTSISASQAADPFDQNRRLGRGVNLGNALEAPSEGEWGVTLREEYFQLIADAGFDAVRIPVRWSAHAASAPPYTIDPSFFERVDWAVNQALSRGLLAVINVHHYEEIFQNPAQHRERFLALWEQIADHYKDYPPDLLFEILNEPNTALTANVWNPLLADALRVVRLTNPDRNVVVSSTEWSGVQALGYLQLPDDDRHLIVTVHYYLPFQFTHQGAEWVSGSEPWLGTTWPGTPAQKQAVTDDFDRVAAWAEKNNRPVYLGEFGAYSKADIESRARWTDFIARQAEQRGFSWAYWEFCAGFGVYNPSTRQWNEPLLTALLPAP